MRKFLFKNLKNGFVYYVDTSHLSSRKLYIIGDKHLDNNIKDVSYEDVLTVLSQEKFEEIKNGKIDKTELLNILSSEDNSRLLNKVIEQEKDMLMKCWNGVQFTRQDVDCLFSKYKGSIKDCSIVDIVYRDYKDVAEHYIDDAGFDETEILFNHVNYTSLGEDIVNKNKDYFIVLPSGAIVEVIYY